MRQKKKKAIEYIIKKAFLKKWFLYTLLIGFLLMLIFFFTPLLFILVFVVVNGILGFFMQPFKTLGIGLELGIFATVIASCVYGPKVGIIGGVMVLLAKLILQGSFTMRGFILIPSHIIIGLLAYFFFDPVTMNITNVGIGFTIFHSLFSGLLSMIFLGANIGKVGVFVFTNIPWNIFLFSYFAPYVVRALI